MTPRQQQFAISQRVAWIRDLFIEEYINARLVLREYEDKS